MSRFTNSQIMTTLERVDVSLPAPKPHHNIFVERFNRSSRDEVIDANLSKSIAEAQKAADVWVMATNSGSTISLTIKL